MISPLLPPSLLHPLVTIYELQIKVIGYLTDNARQAKLTTLPGDPSLVLLAPELPLNDAKGRSRRNFGNRSLKSAITLLAISKQTLGLMSP